MKRLFFKTVKSNGDSLWARGALKKNYQVGKRYTFPKRFPAHVFIHDEDPKKPIDFDLVYEIRVEGLYGNRVLICYGDVEERFVPVLCVNDLTWDLSSNGYIPLSRCYVSTNFKVIGEVPLPKIYKGVRPTEEKSTNENARFKLVK